MEERRAYVRLASPLRVKYGQDDAGRPAVDALVRNISVGGICIFLTEGLEAGKVLNLDISLPDDLGGLYAQAQLLWLKPQDDKMMAGLNFVRISSFDRSRILSFISFEQQRQRLIMFDKVDKLIFFKEGDRQDSKEIVDLFNANLEKIEPGLRLVDKNVDFPEVGRLDTLAIDLDRELVLVELATEGNDALLITALKHFEWVLRHVQILKKTYRLNIRLHSVPRIMLLSVDFSESFRRLVESLRPMRIELFEYSCLESQVSRGIFLKKVANKPKEIMLSFEDLQRRKNESGVL